MLFLHLLKTDKAAVILVMTQDCIKYGYRPKNGVWSGVLRPNNSGCHNGDDNSTYLLVKVTGGGVRADL